MDCVPAPDFPADRMQRWPSKHYPRASKETLEDGNKKDRQTRMVMQRKMLIAGVSLIANPRGKLSLVTTEEHEQEKIRSTGHTRGSVLCLASHFLGRKEEMVLLANMTAPSNESMMLEAL